MSTIMISAYGKLTFLKVILPYSSIILILMYFVLFKKYEVKIVKKIFYSIFRIILIYLLLNMLFNILIHQENMKMNMSEFINYGFNSIYAFDMFGNHRLDFIKFLIILSLFILVEFDLIVFISDCSQGFKEIIKYHSKK